MRVHFWLSPRVAAVLAALGIGAVGACGGKTNEASTEGGTAPDAANGESGMTGGRAGMPDASVDGAAGGSIQAGGAGGLGAGAGGLSGTGGLGDTGDSGPDSIFSCTEPQPILGPNGEPTGYTQCSGDWTRREARVECAATLTPVELSCPGMPMGGPGGCLTDSDCTLYRNGQCMWWEIGSACLCVYGPCTSDDECPPGQICRCGEGTGICVEAACETDADCDGLLCASYVTLTNGAICGAGFACQTTRDACMSHDDCEAGSVCVYQNRRRTCVAIDSLVFCRH